MTILATHPVPDPHQLALLADDLTPLGRPFAEIFREACLVEAASTGGWGELDHGPRGWVNPNVVRLRVLAAIGEDDLGPRAQQFSALWSASAGRTGYLESTERRVRIAGPGSRGNGNKSTTWRRMRDVATRS